MRRNHGRTHLPSGPRIRTHGNQAAKPGRWHRTHKGRRMSPASLNKPLTLALSKGRIFDETLPLLEAAGVHVTENPESSRKLILPPRAPDLQLFIVRVSDVPPYVQYGGAHFGIARKDDFFQNPPHKP